MCVHSKHHISASSFKDAGKLYALLKMPGVLKLVWLFVVTSVEYFEHF